MTPRLPVVTGAAMIRALESVGFRQVGQRGSHVKLRLDRLGEVRTAIVPLHDELAPGTLRSILRQSGLTAGELLELLHF